MSRVRLLFRPNKSRSFIICPQLERTSLSSTGPRCGFYSIGCARPTRPDVRPARASTRRHDRAPCAPESSAHCLNSASLSLSLGSRARLRSNGGRSPRRARSTGSKKSNGHHSSLFGALAGLHASKNASSSSIARTYLHSKARQSKSVVNICKHVHSHAITCNPMPSDGMQSHDNQMQLEALDIPTSRHPDIPSPQRHQVLSDALAVISGTQRHSADIQRTDLPKSGHQRHSADVQRTDLPKSRSVAALESRAVSV